MVDIKEHIGASVLNRRRKVSACEETDRRHIGTWSEREIADMGYTRVSDRDDIEYIDDRVETGDVEDIDELVDIVAGVASNDEKYDEDDSLLSQTTWNIDPVAERNQCCCRCHYPSKPFPGCPLPPTNTHLPPTSRGHTESAEDEDSALLKTCEPRGSESTTVTDRAVKCSDSTHREYTCSRNRLKSQSDSIFSLDPSSTIATTSSIASTSISSSETESVYNRYINLSCCGDRRVRVRTRVRTMLGLLCQGVIVVLLCLCGGVMMYNSNHAAGPKGSKVLNKLPPSGISAVESPHTSGLSSIVRDLPFKSVHLEDLEKHLEQSNSVTDVLKIFFNHPNLSEDDINSIMWMKSHQSLYGSGVSQRRNHNIMNDVEEDETQYREEALKHHREIATSPFANCGDPQPELVQIEEAQKTSFKHFFPHCTILHRCRNTTGCCPRGYACEPRKENGIRIVEKYFLVFKKSAVDGTVIPHAKHFVEAKNFINHTACECHKIEITSNCHKKCPNQFVRERPGENCICRCKPHNRVCRHMYRGISPLYEKDLECIKSGECIKPQCHTGDFKVHTGFCPRFRHRHRNK